MIYKLCSSIIKCGRSLSLKSASGTKNNIKNNPAANSKQQPQNVYICAHKQAKNKKMERIESVRDIETNAHKYTHKDLLANVWNRYVAYIHSYYRDNVEKTLWFLDSFKFLEHDRQPKSDSFSMFGILLYLLHTFETFSMNTHTQFDLFFSFYKIQTRTFGIRNEIDIQFKVQLQWYKLNCKKKLK